MALCDWPVGAVRESQYPSLFNHFGRGLKDTIQEKINWTWLFFCGAGGGGGVVEVGEILYKSQT